MAADKYEKKIRIVRNLIRILILILALGMIGYGGWNAYSIYHEEHTEKTEAATVVDNFKEQLKEADSTSIETSQQKMMNADGNVVGVMTIKALNMEAPIAMGTSQEILKHYIGMFTEYGTIGGMGQNAVFASHSSIYESCGHCFFNHMEDKVKVGDIVSILWKDGKTYNYSVYSIEDYADPYADSYYEADPNREIITMMTCTNGDGQYRTVVKASRVYNE
jgi:LPXTG-site transpeptidase (sortase) family protein